jgi:hypothetical protein
MREGVKDHEKGDRGTTNSIAIHQVIFHLDLANHEAETALHENAALHVVMAGAAG